MFKKVATIASFPIFVLAARFVPFNRLPSLCVFYNVTGYPCPTCGITRSVMALMRLDFHRAALMNPLGFAFVGAFGLWWVTSMYQMATGRQTRLALWTSRNAVRLLIAGLVILIAFGGTRMWWMMR